uniref:tRNA(Ile)-lysidine synthase n=1 Tax=candidate division WOR-3 bacterium TaxID=2052148 RepID=A0A7C6EJT7_UNCW3
MVDKVLAEVKETIEKYRMFRDVKKAVIGFSSGPDSVCLLDVLKTIYGEKIKFFLVYINHGLRSEWVLKKEEELTASYAKKYQCNFKIIKINVKKGKKGIEAEARERRYRALNGYARKISAPRIVLGHNLDDLLETFFMNLIRGSGNIGLQSIPAVRLPFVRPLINIKKKEIYDYLKKRKLTFSEDISNLNTNIRRNFIRQKIIPQFLKLNPNLYATIKRTIEILHNDEEFLQNIVSGVFKKIVLRKGQGFTLDLNRLMYYNKAIGNRVIMKAIEELKGDLTGVESKHIEALWCLNDKKSGKRICLPYCLYAQKIFDRVFIGIENRGLKNDFNFQLKTDEPVEIGNLVVSAEIVKNFDLKKRQDNCEVFDFSQIYPPLVLRNRRTGDVVKIKNGEKKLKEILNEKRVPANERDDVVILCDQEGILWVLGVYRAYRAFIGQNTKNILKVEFEYTD